MISLSLSLSLRQRAWAWHLCFCCIQTSTSGIVFIEDIIDGTWALGLAARSNQTDVTATVPGTRVIICKINTKQCYHPLLSKEWLFSYQKRCHKKNILKLSFLIISICGSIWTKRFLRKETVWLYWRVCDKVYCFNRELHYFECKFWISRSGITHAQNWPIGHQRVGSRENDVIYSLA